MTLKFETNIGHVELKLNQDELRVEHHFSHAKQQYTNQITFDRKQTKQIIKLLKQLESEE